MLANTTKERLAASGLDQFRRPIAGAHQRIGPFQDRNTRSFRLRWPNWNARFEHLFVASQKLIFEANSGFVTIGCFSDAQHVFEDLHQVLWVQRQDLGRRQCRLGRNEVEHVLIFHRADIALGLRDDQVGLEAANQIAVDLVQRISRFQPPLYLFVDIAAR